MRMDMGLALLLLVVLLGHYRDFYAPAQIYEKQQSESSSQRHADQMMIVDLDWELLQSKVLLNGTIYIIMVEMKMFCSPGSPRSPTNHERGIYNVVYAQIMPLVMPTFFFSSYQASINYQLSH